jgi:hypothetical protein
MAKLPHGRFYGKNWTEGCNELAGQSLTGKCQIWHLAQVCACAETLKYEILLGSVRKTGIRPHVDGDSGDSTYLVPGFHTVNQIGYVVTKNPWTDEEADGLTVKRS